MENEPRPVTGYPTVTIEGKSYPIKMRWRDAQRLKERYGVDVFSGIAFKEGFDRMVQIAQILAVVLPGEAGYSDEQLLDVLEVRDASEIALAITEMISKVPPQAMNGAEKVQQVQ